MKNKEENKKTITATTSEMSEIFGLSDRRIRQLENEGLLVKISRGKFDLPASVQRYIETTKEQSESEEEMDLKKEKTLLTRANRHKVEMELKILRGEVHRSEDVEKVMNEMLSSFRAQMLIIPGKVAPLILGQTDLEKIKGTIKKYIYEALQELSDYDPNAFYAKSKDKLSIDKNNTEENGEEQKGKVKKGREKNGSKHRRTEK